MATRTRGRRTILKVERTKRLVSGLKSESPAVNSPDATPEAVEEPQPRRYNTRSRRSDAPPAPPSPLPSSSRKRRTNTTAKKKKKKSNSSPKTNAAPSPSVGVGAPGAAASNSPLQVVGTPESLTPSPGLAFSPDPPSPKAVELASSPVVASSASPAASSSPVPVAPPAAAPTPSRRGRTARTASKRRVPTSVSAAEADKENDIPLVRPAALSPSPAPPSTKRRQRLRRTPLSKPPPLVFTETNSDDEDIDGCSSIPNTTTTNTAAVPTKKPQAAPAPIALPTSTTGGVTFSPSTSNNITTLHTSLKARREEVRRARRFPDGATEDVLALRKSLCDKAMETMKLQAALTATQSELKEVRYELDSAQSTQEATDIALAANSVLNAKVASLTAQLHHLEGQVETLKEELATKTEAAASTEAQLRDALVEREREFASMRATAEAMRVKMEAAEHKEAEARSKYLEAEEERCRLQETVLDLKGSIRVFCRVRPLLEGEEDDASGPSSFSSPVFNFPDSTLTPTDVQLVERPERGVDGTLRAPKVNGFSFNRVFTPLAKQEELFSEVRGLITSVTDGYRVCVFAYGQTGAGKTYTMEGEPGEHRGLTPRAVEHLFQRLRVMREDGWESRVGVEIVEIYNESLRDLLYDPRTAGPAPKLDIHHDKSGDTTVAGVTTVAVDSAEAVLELMLSASKMRSTSTTQCNDQSSRSHLVVTVRMEATHAKTSQTRSGVLNMCDLAGSERLKMSGAGADEKLLKETQHINKSLSTLGQVFSALASKQKHVPFRSSKLTYLLQNSLCGKALMVCNVCPRRSAAPESLCTLRFATSVNSVCTK